jgi:hypothetical protein
MTRAGALGGLFYRIYTGSPVYLGAPPAGRSTIDVCTWHDSDPPICPYYSRWPGGKQTRNVPDCSRLIEP